MITDYEACKINNCKHNPFTFFFFYSSVTPFQNKYHYLLPLHSFKKEGKLVYFLALRYVTKYKFSVCTWAIATTYLVYLLFGQHCVRDSTGKMNTIECPKL